MDPDLEHRFFVEAAACIKALYVRTTNITTWGHQFKEVLRREIQGLKV